MSQNKWRIAVLYGGDSSEREVSVHSGEAVVAALDQKGHVVRPIDVRGRCLDALDDFECDVVFNALHGPFGEDGQLQLLLELRGIPYTGSGVEASRLAMDKAASKECFVAHGLPTPSWFTLEETSRAEDRRAAVVSMGFPQIASSLDHALEQVLLDRRMPAVQQLYLLVGQQVIDVDHYVPPIQPAEVQDMSPGGVQPGI